MNTLRNRNLRVSWLGLVLLAGTFSLPVVGQTPKPTPNVNEYQEGAILWTQLSGEKQALAYQAYTLARIRLDRDLASKRQGTRRRAVVVDIDETVLDNSRYQANLLLKGLTYTETSWTEWVKLAEATAVPGALGFLRYAAARGVRVFYITNRTEPQKEATIANLSKLGFPNVNEQSVRVKTNPKSSAKESRRALVDRDYRIVLLIGDNLNDFAGVFEEATSVENRIQAVEQLKQEFGTRFIVLPNPMYGDWENVLYDYNFKLSEEEKAAKRKSHLQGY